MQATRRDFLKIATIGGASATVFGFDLKPAYAQLRELKIARATETRSTCPYCAVSCGVIIYTLGDKAKNVTPQVIHVEGDPDHPINRGTLCPKGASLEQDILNPRRLMKPQVRRPGANGLGGHLLGQCVERDRAWTKRTRDATFVEKDANGNTVNRCEGIAFTGGCTDTNEFNFLARQDNAQPGGLLPGKPGPGLTRPHGLKFGTNIRTRGDDQRVDRHQKHRHDVDHGR